jgi:actin related protein 2/3 complex, subunit 1A/1B
MFYSAMKKFQSLDRQARINSDYELDTKHQNTLTCLRVHSESNDAVTKFTSSGLDGKIILWELNVSNTLFLSLKYKQFNLYLNYIYSGTSIS